MSRSSTSRPLQVARGFHSVRNSEGQGLCRSAWNTRDACFEECFLPFIFALPFLLSIIVLAIRVGRPLAAYLPQWMRPFITKPEQTSKRSWDGHQRIASFQGRLLLCLSLTGFIVEVTIALSSGSTIPGLLPVAAWASIALLFLIDDIAIPPLGSLFILCSIIFAHGASLVSQGIERHLIGILKIFLIVLAVSIWLCVIRIPLRKIKGPKDSICGVFEPPTSKLRSPEEDLTPWQFMSVTWMAPLISIGSARQMNDDDVWSLPFEFQHWVLHENFRELKGTVVMRLLEANGIDLVITTILAIIESVANYAAPVLLQLLLQSMEDIRAPRRASIIYATLSLIVRLIASQSSVFSLWYCRRCYERSRGEMITMLYEKTLKRQLIAATPKLTTIAVNGNLEEETSLRAKGQGNAFRRVQDTAKRFSKRTQATMRALFRKRPESKAADGPASMGKILNMMRNDVYEVAQRFWEFQNLITKPLGLLLSVLLVWKLMGWSTLIGVSVVVIAQLLNVFVTRVLLYWERKRRSATDGRLQKTTEYVEAIRHLRWYGWQDLWQNRIMQQRQRELNLRIITSLCSVIIAFTNALASNLFPVVAFYAYTFIAKQPLRVDIAFPALQLFNLLENSLREIPGLITVLLNAKVAVDRIESFMAEPDKEDEAVEPASEVMRLVLQECSFSWPGIEALVLQDLNLSFPVGLSLISGKVAAGKSALLQALLGELEKRDGQIFKEQAMIGYCAQSPWLQSMSIRDNILFSYPYDKVRYEQVLESCALKTDLATFKDGDLSNIGENGIGLSGGQRARVALARAVYSRANVLLLDDPLSALDHQTATFIVGKLFGGSLMENRTVVLVTHRTELCHDLAVQVIEIEGGRAHSLERKTVGTLTTPPSSPEEVHRRLPLSKVSGKTDAIPDKFMEDEHRSHGGVRFVVYWEYVKAGKLWLWSILVLVVAAHQLVVVGKTWFLKEWGEAYNNILLGVSSGLVRSLPSPEDNVRPWLLWYSLIAVLQALLFLLSQCAMLVIVYCTGRRMFRGLITRVSRAAFRFYDVTPVGRLMNRLTSDVGTVDGNISQQFQQVAWLTIRWTSSIVIIASVTPTFLVFSFALSAAFIIIFLRFLPTSQSLRRLEMVSLSPLMSNFGALLDGLVTVRAFGIQRRFQDRLIVVVDAFQKMDHFYWSLQAWLMYRFDVLSACSEWILTLLAIYTSVTPGLTAFVLIAASRFVRSTHSLCKQYGKLQMDFVSVERVVEMLHMEEEPQGSVKPPASWPKYDGDIIFEDVTIRYAPHLDPSLFNISFRIPGGSTTALLGRTGSGKSTLALSLLATTLPETGRIIIDGIDIADIDRQALRSRITFLAQDPVLFPGSMRVNLDPLDEFSDDACRAVIQQIGGDHEWTLDTEISAGGQNLSQGQRQLVGLARAVLRRSAVIILDEATASIDMETALQVQRILREELRESTVITIAHRLEAVKNADYHLRLDHGRLESSGPTNSNQ